MRSRFVLRKNAHFLMMIAKGKTGGSGIQLQLVARGEIFHVNRRTQKN